MSTAATTTTTIVPTGTWAIDPSHSSISFSVKHMVIATVRGRFTDFDGSLTASEDGAQTITGAIRAASIDTNEPQRDGHLRSADFFDTDVHPEIHFASHRVLPAGDDRYRIVGDLTIKGTTREVVLDARVNGAGVDPFGNERVALEVRGTVKRKDFGLNWNQLLETGGVLVGETITLTLDLSTVRANG